MNLPVATADLAIRFAEIRQTSERLAARLKPEDCVVQSMPDVSPAKWHLAHTSWFFETFLLEPHRSDYRTLDDRFGFLFNSYYNSVGEQFPRPDRGLLTRPTVAEVMAYRSWVDGAMARMLEEPDPALAPLIELGLNHEQQHQELLLMDIKHVFSRNPLHPAFDERAAQPVTTDGALPRSWHEHAGGEAWFGFEGDGFCFDNERPRHRAIVQPFALASRLVTNAEFLEFIEDGGYRQPQAWLADGWSTVSSDRWCAPLYWIERDDGWYEFTLGGLRPLDPATPVSHLSLYEADAFATWSGARLPDEREWELVAADVECSGNLLESGALHPQPARGESGPTRQLFGDLWEWTRSPYSPYPGFRAAAGAIGEYNGKFMCNQFVLRGGACTTPASHLRASYRNFFYPHQRWQFAGVRLARDAS